MSTVGRDDSETNLFYRDYYQQVIYFFIVIILTVFGMSGFVLYQLIHRPLPQFSAVMPDGRGMMLTPYDEPNLMPATLVRWASKAAVAAYTFNFVDYAKQIEMARPYFTPGGWQAYQDAIGGVITNIVKEQVFVYGVVTNPPVIVNQGLRLGYPYSWHMQIPFLVTYQGAEESKSSDYYVILTVVKVPTTINPDGIGIETFVMKE
jgi:intracellular multiplication protein IcmL